MIGVAPFRAELGIMIRYHVPAVRALPRPLLVCHEPGREALYPECKRVLVPTRHDDIRYWSDEQFIDEWAAKLKQECDDVRIIQRDADNPEQRFVPVPYAWQIWRRWRGRGGIDFTICPRRRKWGHNKNWNGWFTVARELKRAGRTVFAAGAKETSYLGVQHDDASWAYGRSLDAAIEAMRQTRLVIATDAGLAHLAILVGVPLLLIGSNGGLIAPGPATDDKGRVVAPKFWPVRLEEYYQKANHKNVKIVFMPDGWENPRAVVKCALELIS
jgi:hypothetical protein